jgi:hypothetical protein
LLCSCHGIKVPLSMPLFPFREFLFNSEVGGVSRCHVIGC